MKLNNEIDYSSDIIDSRDLYNRLEELREISQAVDDAQEELDSSEDENKEDLVAALDSATDAYNDIKDELKELEIAESEISEFSGGNTLISEQHFEDYCREMLEDCGDIPKGLPDYIKNNIDWSGVASDLKHDYSEITLQGNTFYYRG